LSQLNINYHMQENKTGYSYSVQSNCISQYYCEI
jgi:hypothetical protein